MRIVYIAGPLRGVNRQLNIANAVQMQEIIYELRALGQIGDWFPMVPHTMTQRAQQDFDLKRQMLDLSEDWLPEEYFVEGTLEMMRRCDAVLVIGNWTKSEGTCGEIKEAKRLGIPVIKFNDPITRTKAVSVFEWFDKKLERRTAERKLKQFGCENE